MRKILFWLHLTAGILGGLPILSMCVTGTLLTYERQINAWADRGSVDFTPPGATPTMSPEQLLTAVRRASGANIGTAVLYANSKQPTEIPAGAEGTLLVDPSSGRILGRAATGTRRFFRTVQDWHRWLGATGKHRAAPGAIMDAANLVFFVLVLSGLFLWLPRKMTWQHFRPALLFRRGLRGKARDFNWHHVIGIWAWLPLLVVTGSGLVLSYQWAIKLTYILTGSAIPAQLRRAPVATVEGAPPLEGLDQAWATVAAKAPGWASIRIQLPNATSDPLTFIIDTGDGGQPQARSTLVVDRRTGKEISWTPFSASNRGQQLRIWLRYAHTGESLGIAGQTIAGLATAGGAMMMYTGFALGLRRLLAWRNRR